MKTLWPLALLFLTSCMTPAGPFSTGKIHHVDIDGVPMEVQKMGGANGWAANKADITGGLLDPSVYLLNVRAIEKVTGCAVIRETIVNEGLNTRAAVRCK